MDKEITIITVNYNTSNFIHLMLHSFDKLSFYNNKIIICDNGSSLKDQKNLKKIVQNYSHLDIELVFRNQTIPGSIGHAEALDLLFERVDTPFFITMDSDVVVLMKDWDRLLLQELKYKNLKALGTPSVANKTRKSDFPLIFCALYETKSVRELKCSFLPKNISIGEDTGFDLRGKFIENDLKFDIFEVKNTRYDTDKYYSQILCATYYFNNVLCCSHFSRGSTLGVAKYKKIYHRIPFVGILLLRVIGIIEKSKWINISKEIINEELSTGI